MCGDEIFLTCRTSSRTFILYTITFSSGERMRLYVILGFHPRCALSRGYGGKSPRLLAGYLRGDDSLPEKQASGILTRRD